MLRFLPDSLLEGVLRPFLLADPAAGLYYEEGAPDWRFVALALSLAVAALAGRLRTRATAEQVRTLLLLWAMCLTWTFTIGNGRYFIAGLMLVGPLLVLAWQWLPGTRSFRWSLLVGFMLLQVYTVQSMYRPAAWPLVAWSQGPAVYVSHSPVREKPAVFITVTAISFSALIPHFHPQSRWANLGGQVDMTPSRPEYARSRALLDSPLPKYVLAPANQGTGEPDDQPDERMWRVIAQAIGEHGLEPAADRCDTVRSNLMPHGLNERGRTVPLGAFWICPVRLTTTPPRSDKPPVDAMNDVFDRLEAYCPRFFPPGGSVTKRYEDHWLRYYLGSDTRVFIEDSGLVTYKYFRHFTPTVVASADDVRQGRFTLPCDKLPGRYRPPWQAS